MEIPVRRGGSPAAGGPAVAVIGAGISGLVCARELADLGWRVVVFEKSRSFGGRCATRLWNGHVVDHGAQYFTLTDPRVRASMERRLDFDQVVAIERSILDLHSREPIPSVKGARYFHRTGNNRIGRALADGLEVRREVPVTGIERAGVQWCVAGELFDRVVVSCPHPQAAMLLGLAGEPLAYHPCLTAFFEFEGEPGGVAADVYAFMDHAGHDDLAWSACENHKAGRVASGRSVFVAQASAGFSRTHLERDPAAWAAILLERLRSVWGLADRKCSDVFTHRWRFARVADDGLRAGLLASGSLEEPFDGVFVTGDTVAGSRIESVWRAGLETAGQIGNPASA